RTFLRHQSIRLTSNLPGPPREYNVTVRSSFNSGADMIGIPLGLAYANFGEWFVHKHVLHGLGKNKNSFWAFHWHEHHRESRLHGMVDPQYRRSLFSWQAQTKELAALTAAAALHVPLFPVAPFFT